MRKIGFVLTCLACVGHARRVQASIKQGRSTSSADSHTSPTKIDAATNPHPDMRRPPSSRATFDTSVPQPNDPVRFGALRPTESAHRRTQSLDGIWSFIADIDDVGSMRNYRKGLPTTQSTPIAVPASWNEQLPSLDSFLGPAWYERSFRTPFGFDSDTQLCILRFASVNYRCIVWINGNYVGMHEGGHLPFELDATPWLKAGASAVQRIVLRVDGRLERTHVPPGGGWGAMAPGCFPSAAFDFYPFCGVQRSVLLCVRPKVGLNGLHFSIKLEGAHRGTATWAEMDVRVRLSNFAPGLIGSVRATLLSQSAEENVHGPIASAEEEVSGDEVSLKLSVTKPKLWGPGPPYGSPYLYNLRLEAVSLSGEVVDTYEQRVGIRSIQVEDSRLILNGEVLNMRGFGRHEDFPVVGRADCPAILVRDHACMRWVHANSYRTAHYPYSENDLELADELGMLVVSESPCVGLSFADSDDIVRQRQTQAMLSLRELVERDCCRTCVVAWSVCNEPGGPKSVPTAEAKTAQTAALIELVELAKSEGTRPVTFANIPEHLDEANRACDFLCLNEYAGWYYSVGKPLEEIGRELEEKLLRVHDEYSRPILISECGADTLPGCHMMAPGLWSEEFQAKLLAVYNALAEKHEWLAGIHVWNLCDFRTPQMHLRAAGLNHKGVFTRLREPKMAAHMLKQAWQDKTRTENS